MKCGDRNEDIRDRVQIQYRRPVVTGRYLVGLKRCMILETVERIKVRVTAWVFVAVNCFPFFLEDGLEVVRPPVTPTSCAHCKPKTRR